MPNCGSLPLSIDRSVRSILNCGFVQYIEDDGCKLCDPLSEQVSE